MLAAIAGLARGATEEAAASAVVAAREAGADFGLSVAELQRMADKLPPGHSAVIVLVENLWEREFREAVAKHNGSLNRDRLDHNQALASTSAVPQAPVITVPANEPSQPATPSAAEPDSTARVVHIGHLALTLARSLTTSNRGEGT